METETKQAPLDREAAKERLKRILELNGVKKGSVKGRTIEYAFLHGLTVTHLEEMGGWLFLHQCGRSILD